MEKFSTVIDERFSMGAYIAWLNKLPKRSKADIRREERIALRKGWGAKRTNRQRQEARRIRIDS